MKTQMIRYVKSVLFVARETACAVTARGVRKDADPASGRASNTISNLK